MPCTQRAAISTQPLGASAHSTEATPNTTTPIRSTDSRPNWSEIAPATRISAPSVSRYPSTTHCCRARPPPNSLPIAGSARLTTDPARKATNEANTATATSGRSVSSARRRRWLSASAGIGLGHASVFLDGLPGFPGIMRVHGSLSGPNGQIRHERRHRRERPAHRDPGDAQQARLVGVVEVLLHDEARRENQHPHEGRDVERDHRPTQPTPGAVVGVDPAPDVADDRATNEDRHREDDRPEQRRPDA